MGSRSLRRVPATVLAEGAAAVGVAGATCLAGDDDDRGRSPARPLSPSRAANELLMTHRPAAPPTRRRAPSSRTVSGSLSARSGSPPPPTTHRSARYLTAPRASASTDASTRRPHGARLHLRRTVPPDELTSARQRCAAEAAARRDADDASTGSEHSDGAVPRLFRGPPHSATQEQTLRLEHAACSRGAWADTASAAAESAGSPPERSVLGRQSVKGYGYQQLRRRRRAVLPATGSVSAAESRFVRCGGALGRRGAPPVRAAPPRARSVACRWRQLSAACALAVAVCAETVPPNVARASLSRHVSIAFVAACGHIGRRSALSTADAAVGGWGFGIFAFSASSPSSSSATRRGGPGRRRLSARHSALAQLMPLAHKLC
eukprot:gene17803-12753_t